MNHEQSEVTKGVAAGISAYLIWGFLPIYWKQTEHIPSFEVLAHRIVWSLLFMILMFFTIRKMSQLIYDIRYLMTHPKIIAGIALSAFFISVNWVLFIWAVANEHIVQVSLGYYINPLLNVLLGVLFFKEKLTFWQKISVFSALTGVSIMTFSFGEVPYIALVLAFSFGMYGLVKKQTKIGAMTGLTIETLLLMPAALGYIIWIHGSPFSAFYIEEPSTALLLAGTGAVTAVPLLLFGIGALKIPLSFIGFLQYIAPTIMLVLGVILYGESFTAVHAVSFSFIWLGLLIYSFSKTAFLANFTPK
ncbi:EamA family transporter RarD [Salipaludibacillus sp. CUR1]|uniref:EamA family transporter RarD n=1 Tax=Salipaludibacillus sp. CUR1 TaxID=2820003 RepID=UPI001E350AF7|nr:EamA family transporter RarD [Salipaludibacillus sp. CUR1]MCE7794813.1 EamA family transporter RarD [Salipaludibacillus sp. CUR1]